MKETATKQKIVLFGAGDIGKSSLSIIDNSKIEFFIDNDEKKAGSYVKNYPVKCINHVSIEELKNYHIIITLSRKFLPEVKKQLEKLGIYDYECFSDILRKIRKEKKNNSPNGIEVYKKAIEWILSNTIHEKEGCSIINNSTLKVGYPEVTGYYIPSLIRWGYKDLACSYADWLVSIQNSDGSFMDTEGKSPYIFDTAQIIKGLLAAKHIAGTKYDKAILKACNWIISNMNENGRLITPDISEWGNDKNLELIHLYCISPLYEAANILDNKEIGSAADKIKNYYLENYKNEILDFRRLIHFHAYLMEALLDIGEIELAKKGMESLKHYVDEMGYVPAYSDKLWVCSTGLFQLAIVWYQLENPAYGDKVFNYAVNLQNTTGGWYGSYMSDNISSNEDVNDYFPISEISWANKFFLDALYYKLRATSELYAPNFQNNTISDGRYKEVEYFIQAAYSSTGTNKSFKVLDVGEGTEGI